MRRGVGPATATVEGTVASSTSTPASVDNAHLDGQGQVMGPETETEDEAEWPYDWRKQLRVAIVFVVHRTHEHCCFVVCVAGGILNQLSLVSGSQGRLFERGSMITLVRLFSPALCSCCVVSMSGTCVGVLFCFFLPCSVF